MIKVFIIPPVLKKKYLSPRIGVTKSFSDALQVLWSASRATSTDECVFGERSRVLDENYV